MVKLSQKQALLETNAGIEIEQLKPTILVTIPAHEWYYFPHMTNEELLIFKVFDTSQEVDVRFTAHTAFSDPNTNPDAPARQSIEMRALAFF